MTVSRSLRAGGILEDVTEPADDALSLEMVTAALRLDSADAALYASVLANSLCEALPPDYVTVERERSMSDRMHGRPGEISKVAVRLGDQVMTLAVKNGRPAAEICREVRGVVLSRQTGPRAAVGGRARQRPDEPRPVQRQGRGGPAPPGYRLVVPPPPRSVAGATRRGTVLNRGIGPYPERTMQALDSLPRKIGPYRLVEKIGEGGMGVVYLGADAEGRRVAVKVLGAAVASDPNARHRLAREVETMRRVRNRFVAEVLDADVDGPSPYVVTRYVPGRTLEDTVRQSGPLRGAALDNLAEGLAEALTAIHAAGVVHRDLKPGNVMLDDGQPVVIDFGIAHVPDATRLTKTGLVMGTPGYLAPEVIEGGTSSGASDVHSWGATVAYAATGRQPFGSGTYQTIFFRVLEGQAELDGAAAAPAAVRRRRAVHRPAGAADRALAGRTARHCRGDGGHARTPERRATRAGAPGRDPLADPPPRARRVAAAPGRCRPSSPACAGCPPRLAYRSPAQAARDVADLLPPVVPPARPPRRQAQAAGPPPRQALPRPPDWQPPGLGLLSLAAGVAAVALSVLLPVAGTALVPRGDHPAAGGRPGAVRPRRAAQPARRTAERHRDRDRDRPVDRGPRGAHDGLARPRSPSSSRLLAAAASVVFARSGTLPGAGSWAAGAAIASTASGQARAAPRRQLRRMSASVIRTRAALTVAFISCWALALAVVSSALSQPPLIWPATASTLPHLMPGLPSLGGSLHSVQKWLLGNTVGMLHLP